MELEDNNPMINIAKVDSLAALSQVFDTINPSVEAFGATNDVTKPMLMANFGIQGKSTEYLAQIRDKFKE